RYITCRVPKTSRPRKSSSLWQRVERGRPMSKVERSQRRGPGLLQRASSYLGRRARDPLDHEVEVIGQSGLFDRDYYLQTYPDVAESGMDPVQHYVRHGAAEGRDPCVLFDTRFYIDSNPDVAASGMNPLCHFCEFGWKEGRNPSSRFD